MRKVVILGLVVFLFSTACSTSATKSTSPRRALSQTEEQTLEMARQIQKFEQKELGFRPTQNFRKFWFEVEDAAQIMVCYQSDTEIAFSYKDSPPISCKMLSPEKAKIEAEKLRRQEYDVFEVAVQLAGGSVIGKKMLERSTARRSLIIFHEDWHDNAGLPRHLEESSGDLIGIVGTGIFLGWNKAKIHSHLALYLERAEAINRGFDRLAFLYGQHKVGKISHEDLLKHKLTILADLRAELTNMEPENELLPMDMLLENFGAATVSLEHSYSYYFPLVYRLYMAMDEDLPKTVKVLNGLLSESPWYFKEIREEEIRLEKRLEELIKSASDR